MDKKVEIRRPPKENPLSKENQTRLEHLGEAFNTLFKARIGGTYAYSGEPGFSGDAATLCALVTLPTGMGQQDVIATVGWGEFSQNTFENGKYPVFQQFPLDLYCIRQSDSYFSNDEQRQQMEEDPKGYIKDHSVFKARGGKVILASRIDHGVRSSLDADIESVPYDEILKTVRNSIITTQSSPDEFAAFLESLPAEPAELGEYISQAYAEIDISRRQHQRYDDMPEEIRKKDKMLYLLTGMGINTVGVRVSDQEAMKAILDLKSQFDFQTKSFE